MDFYLIRHGHVDYRRAVDRYAAGLSPVGMEQSRRVAARCREWGIEMVVASTMVRAEQTADAILEAVPSATRWDLDELQTVDVEEPALGPMRNPRAAHWTDEERRLAYERTWVRLMAALARIQLYAETYGLERIAIVTHDSDVNLLLLNWLGLDWRAAERVHLDMDWCASAKVVLEEGVTRIEWVNRPS